METAVMEQPEEAVLAARAASEPLAFAPIYDHYFPKIYNYIRYRVYRADLADDLVARTFARALDKIGTYDSERSELSSWLFAIARNAVNDHLRAGRRRRWVSLQWLQSREPQVPGADEGLVAEERRHRLLAAVSRLSSREQEIIAMRFGAGQTNRKISGVTGLSESNVGVILHRAVRKLRSMLGDEEQYDAGE